jgi:hypothetical protein
MGSVADAARTFVTTVLMIVNDDLDQEQEQKADE